MWKNADILPSYGLKCPSKYQLFHKWALQLHTFFGHNSAIFGPIELKFLWELRRLVFIDLWWEIMILMRFLENIFLARMGVASTLAPKGLGSQSPTQNWPTGCNFRINRYLKKWIRKLSASIRLRGVQWTPLNLIDARLWGSYSASLSSSLNRATFCHA